MTRSLHLLLALLGLTLFVGCPSGDDDDSASTDDDDATVDDDDTAPDDDDTAPDDDDSAAPPDLEGVFLDAWGTFHVIDAASWVSGVYPDTSTYAISWSDPSVHAIVAQNAATNAWNPGLWSRFDWNKNPAGELWFCQTAYDAADEAAALSTPAADPSDPANGGCGGFAWTRLLPDAQGPTVLVGDFVDAWGTHHSLRQGLWSTRAGSEASAYALTAYDNDEGWTVGQNGADNPYNPNLWSRFDVAEQGGDWYLCQTAYDAADEAAALATPAADATDPAAGGCGSFPWTLLGQDQGLLALVGSYTDEWGTEHAVEPWLWTTDPGVPASTATYDVVQYHNADRWLIAQNGAANLYNPSLWSRFDWTDFQGDTFSCQTAYDAATADDALATPAADPTDPTAGGCGGFAWTNLTP